MKFNVGAVIEDAGNSNITKTGNWRTFRPVVKNCVKCGTCAIFCPEGAIVIKDAAEVDYDYCKGCGICANECPIKGIVMEVENK